MLKKIFLISYILSLVACNVPMSKDIDHATIRFDEDSAYHFILQQISFGARVPNSSAHDSCSLFLINKLKSYNAKIIVQNAEVTSFDGKVLKIKNIIAQFDTSKTERIMFFAHWDSRFISDYETDSIKYHTPVLGANDGASGVAVLLEVARQISSRSADVGVDIIFFDAEDQGEPTKDSVYNEKSWCLGAQYWANNQHVEDYQPLYGICIDMLGATNATFTKEDNSRHFSGYLTKKLWERASEIGHSKYFVNELSNPILHDHLFISKLTGIRTLLIIDYSYNNAKGFPDYWHTNNDSIQNVDKNTLNAVGELLLNLIYSE